MQRSLTLFISDLHLGARYLQDPRRAEKRVVDFLEKYREQTKHIYLVGDILDYWYEYKYVVPRGFVRFFGMLARLADEGIGITWLIGNHDIWLFDYLKNEIGIEVVDGSIIREIDGSKFFITHGDDIDDSSRSFRMLRALFRSRFCQRLYAAIHPRWTIPLALGWSKNSRSDMSGKKAESPRPDRYLQFAEQFAQTHPDIDWYIFGHLHILYRNKISTGAEVVVLGDWISHFSYAIFDGRELQLLQDNPL